MMQAFFNAASGLKSQQKNIDTISNNISNINTNGYKKERVSFKDAIYVALTDPENPVSDENLMQGNGVLVNTITKVFTPSNYVETGYVFDVAIGSDEGFFVAQSSDGDEEYTRNGNFKISDEDGHSYLISGNGNYILDENNNKIEIEDDRNKLQIDKFGNLYNDSDIPFAKLKIVNFTNNEGLQAIGNSTYAITESSGEPIAMEDPNVKHKFLEQSNVDLTEEMTNLIKAQRAYQFSSKALTTADQMEGLANNLRA